jgi:glucose-6-phosphate 1-dehydrogenase
MAEAGRIRVRNRVQDELCIERIPDACGAVIFGASGDLTARKLIPSLYNLHVRRLLPKAFYVIGVARTAMSEDQYRARMREATQRHARGNAFDPAVWTEFEARLHYHAGDYDDPETYAALVRVSKELDRWHGSPGHLLFYLSTPPPLYPVIVEHLAAAGLNGAAGGRPVEGGWPWRRLVVEKPFGRDEASAVALNRTIASAFLEEQIYRIDHYLGKDTVQNILQLRFANTIFEPVWNRLYVDHVQIVVAESIGLEHRAGYYEEAGCIRDIFQNHMMQLVAIVAMEPPATFDADRVRDERAKVIRSFRPIAGKDVSENVVRGQYARGRIAAGEEVPGYREEPGVRPESPTDTFVAMRLAIDNSRWRGVPFYLRSGKRLPERVTEIAVQFKHVPHSLFNPIRPEDLAANLLVMRIQPDEGISLRFESKHPGPKLCLSSVTMDFDYVEAYGIEPPEAYERLYLDAMLGDQTLFARQDEVRLCWRFLMPILERWEGEPASSVPLYPAGSWGPDAAMRLTEREGRAWRIPD